MVEAAAGELVLDYSATIDGRLQLVRADPVDLIRYTRPSRYAESDALAPTAAAEFAGLATSTELLAGVSSWVGTRLTYVGGSSLPTDGAVRTLLARQGVWRDFAHVCVALLRGLDIPARLVSVYAPGVKPMDFHAVAEAWVEREGAELMVHADLGRARGADADWRRFGTSWRGAERSSGAPRRQGLDVLEHPYPDHHLYTPGDIDFADDLPILMTEKDAVKCKHLIAAVVPDNSRANVWSVPVSADIADQVRIDLIKLIKQRR